MALAILARVTFPARSRMETSPTISLMDVPVAGSRTRPLVGILLFDGVEVLDFAGPYEVFSGTEGPDGQPFVTVVTIGPTETVTAQGGLRIMPTHLLTDCPPLDALIVPGGPGADLPTPVQRDHLLPFLRERAAVTPLTASVCTGAFLLGRAGLLDGLRVTTNHHALDALAAEIPAAQVEGGKLIDTGRLVTAAGVSSGIDLALHLMERWFGAEARRRAADGLEGPWS
jgi:transcriptional regulator GlxA family with amidase domain